MAIVFSQRPFILDVELLRGAENPRTYRIKGCTSKTTLGDVMAKVVAMTGIPFSEQRYLNASILNLGRGFLGPENLKDKIDFYAPSYFRKLYLVRVPPS